MKMKIVWHQKCLKNSTDYKIELEKELNNLQQRVDKINKYVAFLSLQIQTAVERGLEGFDSEKFMNKIGKDMKKSIDK